MRNVISFLTGVSKDKIDSLTIRFIIVDILTILLGAVIMLKSFFNYRVDEDGVIVGSSLLVLGFLIKGWRKALYKN